MDFTPEQFKQHLDGFVKAEKELAKANIIKDSNLGQEKFLTQKEADRLVKKYKKHWDAINLKSGTSNLLEEKKELGKRRLTKEDRNEFVKYNYQFLTKEVSGLIKDETGKVVPSKDPSDKFESKTYLKKSDFFTIDPNLPLMERINAVKTSMRGGFSNRAQVRQLEGSKFPNLAEIPKMNDEVKTMSSKKDDIKI